MTKLDAIPASVTIPVIVSASVLDKDRDRIAPGHDRRDVSPGPAPSCAAKHHPGEPLPNAPGGGVLLALGVLEDERRTEKARQLIGVVAGGRQSGARDRPVGGKGREHNDSARGDRRSSQGDVSVAIGSVDEEVENGSVVPGVEGARRPPRTNIARNDANRSGAAAEAVANLAQRLFGNVEDGDVDPPFVEERVNERRSARTDVDDRTGR